MIVLGVDPGLSMTGWGVVSKSPRGLMSMLDYGCVVTSPSQKLPQRLKEIHTTLCNIIEKNKPEVIAIEELFFSKQARTVAAVAQSRGVILLAAAEHNVPVFEYNPKHIKIALTGYGAADKNQMQHMVKLVLGLPQIPKPDDAADALAMAICHLNTSQAIKC
ncbi:MAG: crossover junction endodeoxyribonuclease RuvC [Endomicrobiales bacterium]|nr:crossover junction endodeoxyribonuclease RuvC [Endomicrobiales bacterium]